MSKLKYIAICLLVLVSCARDNDEDIQSLTTYIQGRTVEQGAVIACAASDEVNGDILTFYYAESGASNGRFYETLDVDVDSNDFKNYTLNNVESDPIFNGHLRRFTQSSATEKWIIITFELADEIKISNPIRTKQLSKPTVWNDKVNINQSSSGMPNFSWNDNAEGDNAIYFQVVSAANGDLLSGTYTYENQFQYYNTSNVVLNVTTQTPPNLIFNENYNFTLMDVSLDNWVNWVIQKSFVAE
ncbi:hypothetical protein AAFN75_09990 [Algibacter sp. AS12]|uniref:hypothetical protein n=1 Tax=Algibacter sp. AS12 TaxID=3135773 RepID=UPI00398A6DE8